MPVGSGSSFQNSDLLDPDQPKMNRIRNPDRKGIISPFLGGGGMVFHPLGGWEKVLYVLTLETGNVTSSPFAEYAYLKNRDTSPKPKYIHGTYKWVPYTGRWYRYGTWLKALHPVHFFADSNPVINQNFKN